jgi:hypothetical protein
MDITLQNHCAVNLATQLIKNPVVNVTGHRQSSGPPAAAVGNNHAATNLTTVTPITVPKIKTEPIHPNPQQTLFSKSRSTTRTFEWQGKPTNEKIIASTLQLSSKHSRQSSPQHKTQSN